MQDMVGAEDPQIGKHAAREAELVGGEPIEEQVDGGQEVGSGQTDDAERIRREREGEPCDI
jgi:hypothetical protein